MGSDAVRSGAVLLEVLVALTIFAVASAAVLARGAQARVAVMHARAAEARVARASAFMNRVALWPRADLDRHLGMHSQGEWLLEVQRATPVVYTLRLIDSTGTHVVLASAVYRSQAGATEP